jgi:glutathione S-transferase
MRAATPEGRARAALITRLHDLYIASVQASMYRAMEPAARAAGIAQIAAQLDLIEGIAAAGGGPFLAGDAVTTADSALLPTVVFMRRMLPDVFGWKDVFAGRPALARWWEAVQASDPTAARVVKEVDGGLDAWFAKDRFAELGIREQVATQKDFKWAY